MSFRTNSVLIAIAVVLAIVAFPEPSFLPEDRQLEQPIDFAESQTCQNISCHFGIARNPGLKMVARGCGKCSGKGAIEWLQGVPKKYSFIMEGTDKNKKNGNMFERWKCYECQVFGLLSCPICGKGGLTPEQRER